MSVLERRLSALERDAAESMRREQRRQMRDLILSWPEPCDLTSVEVEEATDEALRYLARVAQWRREGLSEREVMRRAADEVGLPIAEVEAAYREAAEYASCPA